MSSLSLNCFAVDDSEFSAGFFSDNNTVAQSVAGRQFESSKNVINAFASSVSDPVYPNFDINLIDLSTIPKDIYLIIQSDNRFIFIQVWSSTYRIFVARNGFLYRRIKDTLDSTGNPSGKNIQPYVSNTLFGFGVYKAQTTESYWDDSCLYSAVYNYDGSIRTDWNKYPKTSFASQFQNKDHLYQYTGELADDICDFYYIGDIKAGISSNTFFDSKTVWTTKSNGYFYGVQLFGDPSRYAGSFYSPHYFKSLQNFPSFESQQDKTTKGIWATLKEIPTKISDVIKSLFVPSDDFYNNFGNEIQSTAEEHLGILYAAPEQVINTLEKFVSFEPDRSNYSLTLPAIKAPSFENGGLTWYQITDDTPYEFDWINEQPYSILYTAYRSFVWLIFIICLINLCIHKYDQIMKG